MTYQEVQLQLKQYGRNVRECDLITKAPTRQEGAPNGVSAGARRRVDPPIMVPSTVWPRRAGPKAREAAPKDALKPGFSGAHSHCLGNLAHRAIQIGDEYS